jgi:hypothetical protein
MSRRIELLVHAGAPTSHGDDERYESQARAYCDLSKAAYSRMILIPPADHAATGKPDQDLHKPADKDETSLTHVFLDNTQLAIGALDSQWLDTTALTRNDPRSRVASTKTLPGVCRKKVQLEEIQNLDSDDRSQREAHTESSNLQQPATPVAARACDHQMQRAGCKTSPESNSQLPSSYSLTNSESLRSRSITPQRATSVPGPVPRLSDVRLEPAPALVRVHSSPAAAQVASAAAVLTADSSNNNEQRTTLRSRHIRPKDPPISLATYSTHVTPALRHLDQDSSVASCYKPLSVTRQIEPLERGHWLIPCDSLPQNVEDEFWGTLQSVVGNGSAGWATWCSQESHDMIGMQPPEVSAGWLDAVPPIRVYCWGEVVKHVYLLLYVASNSRVRRLGLQWIDADGVVVVQMRTG